MKKAFGILTAIAVIGTSTLPLCAATAFTASGTAVPSQAYTYKNVQIGGGGYVDDIVFNTSEQNLIYARTDMGGAYRWDGANQKWIPLTDWVGHDNETLQGCDSLATDPVDPNRVYIMAGKYTNDWSVGSGAILRSDDKGNTWDVVELPFRNGANMLGRSFGERLAVDPNSDNVLYMGTRCGNGLWKSTDFGATWARVTSFTQVGDLKPTDDEPTSYDTDYTGVVWVTPDPSSSTAGTPCQTIYVGVVNKAGENSIFVTHNGGSTWAPLAGQPVTTVTVENDDSTATVQRGLKPEHGVLTSGGILYLTYTDTVNVYSGQKGDVWKYNTATGVWTCISPVSSTSSDDYFGYGGISVDAQHPNTLVVTTFNQWWPDANIWRSTDGGSTWTPFWEWNGYPDRTLRYTQDISYSPWLEDDTKVAPEAAIKIGWMMGNISIDPFDSDRMMYGTGATVYGTDNLTAMDTGGKVHLSVYSKGIEQTVAPVLISPTTGTAHLISGLYDIGGFVHTDLDAVPSKAMTSPNLTGTSSIDYAELNPSKYVRVGNTSTGSSPRIGLSYDTGTDWYTVNNCWSSSSTDTTTGGTVAMSADGNTIVWAPGSTTAAVSYSTNSGSSWSACTGLPAQAIVASDRVNPDKFYAYAAGALYVSTNGGRAFTKTVSTGIPTTAAVNLKAMPGAEGDIWMAGGDDSGAYGLWHSTDSGVTFTKLSNVDKADTIGFGMAAPGSNYMALYMEGAVNGTRGFYRSDDAGASWIRINTDSQQFGLDSKSITGDPRIYGRVYIGTDGRGILYGDIAGSSVQNSSISPTTASFDLKTANQANIPVTLTLSGNTLSGVYNGTTALVAGRDYTVSGTTVTLQKAYLAGLPVGTATLTFKFSAGVDRTLSIAVTDTTGQANAAITPTAATFDLYTPNQANIPVTLTLAGNTLSGIYNGTTALVSGRDYTVSGTTVTLQKAYLATLSAGTASLRFDFSAGVDPTLAITVVNTTPPPAGSLKVQLRCGNTDNSTGGIAPSFNIVNTGSSAIDLSKVKVRYYYTEDGTQSQSFWCDYSPVGSANVTGTFGKITPAATGADSYLEVGFTSAAGSLAPGASVIVQTRFSKADWSSYTQSNDYSFNATYTSFTDTPDVTGYLNGTLQWGTAP